ncbi:MAG: hypothetical protein HPY75_11645 [Actinobacteria bacterium]|nr:hypothetical protein [Actinomycetota bacterium]
MFKGSEIRKLVVLGTLCGIVLIACVSLYLMVSSRHNLSRQTSEMKTAMAEQIADNLQRCYRSMEDYLKGFEGMELTVDVGELLDSGKLYDFFNASIMGTYNADFCMYFTGEELVAAEAKPGVQIPSLEPGAIETGAEYAVLDSIDGREGVFFLFQKEGIAPQDTVIYAIDDTAQVTALRRAYQEDKSAMVKRQLIVVAVIFLAIIALSIALMYLFIDRLLKKPILRLNDKARTITRGGVTEFEEVKENSLFANLQRLLNSGRTILGKAGGGSTAGAEGDKPVGNREINKVIAVWTAVTASLLLISTVIILVSSIALMNGKTDAILSRVEAEMAEYFSHAYDSVTAYAKKSLGTYVGREIWDPHSTIDREAAIEHLNNLLRSAFDCDAAVAYIEDESGGRYFEALKEGVELEGEKPDRIGEPVSIREGYFEEGDLVIVMMENNEYPGYANQFTYYIVNVTTQADVLDDLYRSGASSLLANQLAILLVFLALCLLISPLVIALSIRRYITRPILELNAWSERIIEGDLEGEVRVDEGSAFAEVQRLLKKAQELLRLVQGGE